MRRMGGRGRVELDARVLRRAAIKIVNVQLAMYPRMARQPRIAAKNSCSYDTDGAERRPEKGAVAATHMHALVVLGARTGARRLSRPCTPTPTQWGCRPALARVQAQGSQGSSQQPAGQQLGQEREALQAAREPAA